MKQVKMMLWLLLCATIFLLAACSKEDEDTPGANLQDLLGFSSKTNVAKYEAEWVINRQVVDKTTVSVYPNSTTSIDHMPNEYILANVLTNEQRNLAITDFSPLNISYRETGYSLEKYYNMANGDYSSTDFSNASYRINIGELPYEVSIKKAFNAIYDMSQSKDQWTMKFTITKVDLRPLSSSSTEYIEVWESTPFIELTLVTTKRLE